MTTIESLGTLKRCFGNAEELAESREERTGIPVTNAVPRQISGKVSENQRNVDRPELHILKMEEHSRERHEDWPFQYRTDVERGVTVEGEPGEEGGRKHR